MEYTVRLKNPLWATGEDDEPTMTVKRYGCTRGHPHPTSAGASVCETARIAGATDAQLLVLFNAEVAEYNS